MNDFELHQVTESILRQDIFYRLLQRGRGTSAYQEVCELAYQSLTEKVRDSNSITAQWTGTEERWHEISTLLLTQMWQDVLDETQLKAIALHAQQYSLGSAEFQRAIDILIRALFLSNRLKKRPDFASDEAYREAQNILQLWICQNIHKFNPERGDFTKWINFRFDRTHIPQATDQKIRKRSGIPVGDYDFDRLPTPTLDLTSDELFEWLEQDYIFRIPNRDKPHITFLDIILARTQNQTWQDIAQHYGFNRLTTPRNFLVNWLGNLMLPIVDDQPSSTLQAIRFSRFEGESWKAIAQRFQMDEAQLKQEHQNRLQRFPSYRDVTRNERYQIEMADHPDITFSTLVRLLLETGHLWREPSQILNAEPEKLKIFYRKSLIKLWPQTRPSAPHRSQDS